MVVTEAVGIAIQSVIVEDIVLEKLAIEIAVAQGKEEAVVAVITEDKEAEEEAEVTEKSNCGVVAEEVVVVIVDVAEKLVVVQEILEKAKVVAVKLK